MLMILLISAAWLAILGLTLAICRMATQGDRTVPGSMERSPRLPEYVPLSWEEETRALLARHSRPRGDPKPAGNVGSRSRGDLYVSR